MLQKGIIVSISRRILVADDVGVVARMIEGLGRAARLVEEFELDPG